MSKLSVKTAGLTDQGKVRTNNEDAVCVDPETNLLIVADGMGGHKSGEVASGIRRHSPRRKGGLSGLSEESFRFE